MERHRGTFRLNRCEGKVLGVCAGIADHFDIDVTLVRVGMALAIIMTFPVVLFGYFILAAVADAKRAPRRKEAPASQRRSVEETRQRMRDLDARLQAIEADVVGSNSALAGEIDALR